MFCNGPKTDEGDIARLGPMTITGMTILKVLFVLDHDSERYRWFGRSHQLPPYSWGCPYLRRSQEYEKVCLLSHGCTYLVGCDYIFYMYIYVFPSSSFFFYLFFFFFTLGTLFCIDGLLAAWHTLWPRVWLRLAGKPRFRWKSFQFPAFFEAKGLLILIFPFCSFSLLLLSYFPSACGVSSFLCCAFRPLSSQFPPNFKVCSLFKLFFFLIFCLLNSFSLFFSAFSFDK